MFSIAWWKARQTFGRIREQIDKNLRCNWGFSRACEFSQTLPRFSPGYEGTENMIYFFYNIFIFWLYKKKDDMQSLFVWFYFFHETANSYNLGTANHIADVIFVLHSTCWPIMCKARTTKLFYKIVQLLAFAGRNYLTHNKSIVKIFQLSKPLITQHTMFYDI